MLRSRLKRLQPSNSTSSENGVKRGFVAPRSFSSTEERSQSVSINKQKPLLSITPKETSLSDNGSCDKRATQYCYSVLYYKAGPKKKKTYLDGILYIDKKMFSLFDSSGKQVRRSLETYDASDFVNGCTIDLGMWVAEISSPISIEDYTSGRVFLQTNLSPVKKMPQSQTSSIHKQFTLHTKSGSSCPTEPIRYTGLYTATEGSFVIQPSFVDDKGNTTAPVILDPSLNNKMKPHQKEGLLFLYNCITGLTDNPGTGCILADEMGLGKTLTAISLIYTLLTQSPWSKPFITSAVVTCPSSLVDNWGSEFIKWIGSNRIRCIALKEKGTKAEHKIHEFVVQSGLNRTVLIVSYEMYRKYADEINKSRAGLLVCDEGHRLKSSAGNATIDSLLHFPSRRRLLLSGTPIQNDLEELFALSEFVNPGIFSSLASFRQLFIKPIEAGRKKGCSESDHALASMRSAELSRITDRFILRRTTASVLRSSLPPKITHFMFTPLSSLQRQLYEKIVDLQRQSLVTNGGDAGQLTLTFLHTLRLLCVHPSLIKESIQSTTALSPLQTILESDVSQSPYDESIKMQAIELVIETILSTTDEQLLVISSYTQILDYITKCCDAKQWGYFRLDGQTEVSHRQSLVNSFNNRFTKKRIFILSARAGGVGLNITGASRVLLIEPAWNPAVDSQSIARAWRFGQNRCVYVYRFFIAGSIEEVMLQRQILKKSIADVAVDHTSVSEGKLDADEMREVFKLKDVDCHTYLLINRKTPKVTVKRGRKVIKEEEEEEGDVDAVWKKYYGVESVNQDPMLHQIVADHPTLFSYIATEKTCVTDEEEAKPQEPEVPRELQDLQLDSLDFSECEFILYVCKRNKTCLRTGTIEKWRPCERLNHLGVKSNSSIL